MASRPPSQNQPPESIIVGRWDGLRNNINAESLTPKDLERALNVNLDDAGQALRRRGYVRKLPGRWHSASTALIGRTFAVQDGMLGEVFPGFTFSPLMYVGDDPLSYTEVASTVYFSSRSVSGKIIGDSVVPWGDRGGQGQWISPVMTPDQFLGPVGGRLFRAPPLATEIEHYKGRIYLAAENVLWATELYDYDRVDTTRNFMQFEAKITAVGSTTDGLYVGTENSLLFLQGTLSDGFKIAEIASTPILRGSMVTIPNSKVHPQAVDQPVPDGDALLIMTSVGVCTATPGGNIYNLTQDRMVFPDASSAATMWREDRGINSYVAVLDSGGTPTANARLGDFVDATIIRAADRGSGK
jgi:hypothetical protein